MPTPILLLAPTPAVYRSLRRQLRGLTPESILVPGGRFLRALPRPLARRVCALNGAEGRAIRATPQFEVKPELSRRQLQVLEQLRLGLPNKTIASRLHLSEATVKSHVSAVLRILGAANRTEAIYKAARADLDSRLAIHTVEARITAAPSQVAVEGHSENSSHPRMVAQTRSRNFTDWVEEMSLTPKERVRQ